MHQTFYIDLDEEVNSVINRIRKSNAKYNILVIAQGALLMQSSVSLKLIKREADNLDKKIMFVTKDERAGIIARKIGFPVKKSLEELNEGKNDISQTRDESEILIVPNKKSEVDNKTSVNNIEKKSRLINLGSDSFISDSQIVRKPEIVNVSRNNNLNNNRGRMPSEDSFRNLFVEPAEPIKTTEKEEVSTNKILKFLWIFVIFIGILLLGIAGYFFLPTAEVNISPLKKSENLNLKINISENPQSSQNNTVDLKIKPIEEESVLALTFDATGQKGDSNQKAKGTITIYNEFSETSQVLVATTRLLSNDNKLFRLLETVTVPGMKVENGKTEAGTIEATIIADEAGENFNIKEADFTIPGLKGSPKYDKFYAKLTQETKGGGSSGDNLKTVSKGDIESAKFKTENQLKEKLKESIKNNIGQDGILLDNATAYEIVDFSVFPEEGSVTENFEYQVKMRAKALSFSSSELDGKITEFINSNVVNKNVSLELVSFEKNYGNADINFSDKMIKTSISVNAKLKAEIDKEKISNSLAGKKKEEMSEIIGSYPEVSRAEATISPSFISNSFPKYPSKIKVVINND